MYPQEIVRPMKEELTSIGFNELLTRDDVITAIEKPGTTLVVVNSICGCAELTLGLVFIPLFKIIKSQIIW